VRCALDPTVQLDGFAQSGSPFGVVINLIEPGGHPTTRMLTGPNQHHRRHPCRPGKQTLFATSIDHGAS
jgi:hypothetical protein